MGVEKALLVDYEYCLGCSECETACMTAHGLGPESLGIKVTKLGPWKTKDGSWQYDFVPLPTDWCDLCAERVTKGQEPACVHHCLAQVMKFGRIDDLVEDFKTKPRQVLWMPN